MKKMKNRSEILVSTRRKLNLFGSKKGLEISFATIFALIAGAAILFLAIYFAASFTQTQQTRIDAQTAKKLAVLTEPLQTSIGESKSAPINFGVKTRLYNDRCSTEGNFGEQEIDIAAEGFGGKWHQPTYGAEQYNKYIFSGEVEEGKEFYVFVMPFNLPFKVSDLIFLTSKKYCLVSTPENIESKLERLGIPYLNFTDSVSKCTKESQKVCFSSASGCNISVYGEYGYKRGYVEKEGKKLEFIGPLLYGAIFSSPEVYNCNVKRLKMRLVSLCELYKDEIKILERSGCNSQLDAPLSELIALANTDSENLMALQEKAEEIGKMETEECEVFNINIE